MTDATRPATEETPVSLLRWPPPGLARIQGDLWVVARKMALVAAVLVVPLLITLVLPQSPYGLGPLGEAWWITLLTTILGVAIFTDAVVTLVRFLSRIRRALEEGYAPAVLALVISDRDRDNGFLLQGVGPFTPLEENERKTLGRLRFLIPLLYLVAATWFVVGFAVLLLMAARGVASAADIGFGTMGPAAVIGFAGLVLRGTEGTLAYRSREAWHAEEWSEDLARHEIDAWLAATEERNLLAGRGRSAGAPVWPTAAMVGVIVGAFLAVLPAMTFVPAASLGAVFSSLGGWGYTRTLQRYGEAEAYRPYVLPADSTIAAAEAGELVHTITFVGMDRPVAEEVRTPERSYDTPWLPENPPEVAHPGVAPYWTDTIWVRAARGFSTEEAAFLRDAAAHPARADFARLARAPSVDVVGAFYHLPFDESETFFSLPFLQLSGLRGAAHSHLAHAAVLAADGRYDDAEEAVREVISTGFLLTDEAPLLMMNLVGLVMVHRGGVALANLFALRGEEERAEALRASARASGAAVETMTVGRDDQLSGQEFLERLPQIAANPNALPGMRWDMVHLVTVYSPCANLQRVVFGPDEDYYSWVSRVRASLVRHDSEEDFFELARRGLGPVTEPGFITRLLAVPMGGLATQGSCAQVLAAMPEL